jgi:hypothetical protein
MDVYSQEQTLQNRHCLCYASTYCIPVGEETSLDQTWDAPLNATESYLQNRELRPSFTKMRRLTTMYANWT